MRPRHLARVQALDPVAWLSDYITLTCSIALTVIVLCGLQHIGPGLPAPSATSMLKHVFRVPVVEIYEFSPPAPLVQASSIFDQELAMRPSKLIDRWNPLIMEASRRFGLSATWIKAVMRVESGGRTVLADNEPITSHAGAVGIMQMMPKTYREMRAEYGLGVNPFNPHDNVIAATAYLRTLYRRYGFPNMFAAYNGGPGKLEDHLETGAPLPDETQNYVASITRILGAKGERNELAALGPRRGRRFTAMLHG